MEFGAATALYAAAVLIAMPMLDSYDLGAWRPWVAIAPVPPAFLMAVAVLRHVRRMDEMHRAIVAEAASFTMVLSALGALAYGFLEIGGIIRFPHPMIWVGPAMIALYGVMVFVARARR